MPVSLDMASDFQNLLLRMSPEEFRRMLERSLLANNATSLQVIKEVVQSEDGEGFEYEHVMVFRP